MLSNLDQSPVAALNSELELFHSIADYTPAILWVTDPDGQCTYLNDAWRRFTGQTVTDALGSGWLVAVHPDDRVGTGRIFLDANSRQAAFRMEYRLRTSSGGYRWALGSGNPHFASDGQYLGLIGSVVDIHDLKLAEERQQLLINELNHRVKNTLTTVQALARRSSEPGSTARDVWGAFEDRLLSLASAHDLLTANSWSGAKLPDVVDRALNHWGRQRVDIDGPEVSLSPQQALSLSMAFHELTTNAAKYGALSEPDGRVTIAWRREGSTLHLAWQERGGPRVSPPERRGFGSRLLEHSLARELQGQVALTFTPEGVCCDIVFGLGH
jgi:PAS domain S-box-containing protein